MDIDKAMQFLLEQQAKFDARIDAFHSKFEEEMLRIESVMLSVATTQQRTSEILATLAEKHVELAEKQRESHQELAKMHEITEQKLQALIVALDRHIADHK